MNKTYQLNDIDARYTQAHAMVAKMFADPTISQEDIDTVAFLMKLVRSRQTMVVQQAAPQTTPSQRRAIRCTWTPTEMTEMNAVMVEHGLDGEVKISASLLDEIAIRFPGRKTSSIQSKVYEVRHAMRAKKEMVSENTTTEVRDDNI